MPQMPPMDPYMQPGMPPMQPPPPFQGGTAGGPGPNFTDAIAAGYAHATSLNETVDSVPKVEPPSDDKPGVSDNMDDIEARLRALNDV